MYTTGPRKPVGAGSTAQNKCMSQNKLPSYKPLSQKTWGGSRKTKGYLPVWANNQTTVGALTLATDTSKMGEKNHKIQHSEVGGRRISIG